MRALVLVLALLASIPAHARAPITLIVNFVAGGPSDLMARLLAPELSAALGAQVVVKNTIGAAEAARARPDGTSVLLSPLGAMVIQPNFRSDLPYRPAELQPVCQVADTPVVLMSAPGGPRTLAEAAARAREGRGAFNFASTGPGAMPHIATVALARLEAACQRALRAPAVIEGFRRLATPIVFRNTRDFTGFRDAELATIMQSAGIRPGD